MDDMMQTTYYASSAKVNTNGAADNTVMFRQRDYYSSAKLLDNKVWPQLYTEVDFHSSNSIVELFHFHVELPCPEKVNRKCFLKFQLKHVVDPTNHTKPYTPAKIAKFFLKDFHQCVFDKIMTGTEADCNARESAIVMHHLLKGYRVMLQGPLIVQVALPPQ